MTVTWAFFMMILLVGVSSPLTTNTTINGTTNNSTNHTQKRHHRKHHDVERNVTIPQYGTFIPGSANWVSDSPTSGSSSSAQSLGWGTFSVGQTYGVYSYMDQYGESTQGGDGPSGGHTQGGPGGHGHYGAGHGY